ncbi:ABC transporter ATP-binding protein [Nocardia seriolae]|uniref:ABC transporter ATP-binding protein n=1 Tax=Nocardia seriolae TaxID=37332 RepID=A0A0B8NIQ6_9NOCA|nr:ABC transporter ATP-binding protein [Nocardia seriolae]APA97730.1 Thiamine import ATP-binding protein ThiQ [Nocardia seriolae]MTJ64500.1 ATP-binding cassette domain-containing protein [Nocardia seriolae]MTJ74725.1 ATP-binding cassette domain-containing protein [Nocardia seriolae]MTJ87509.1 ATP-binding cassette domain-containing protein [Nocardia seriolae]MTK31500.1 ATP-binding cassette domain-containing protein [Nocardia seriolae]
MELTAQGLVRGFGKHVAVAHADVTLTGGRITGLIGPNGAGKTTLLLMLAGLLAADAGSIRIDGETPGDAELRREIGWMPDTFGTWDSLTATEILTAFGRLYGESTARARHRAAELLELVHLTEFSRRPAQELSRGQKQRLGFARALVHRPRVLLLDEPASGMDPRSRIDLRDQLRALADDGCAIMVSSHILTELSEMVDDVIAMTAGRTHPPAASHGPRWRIREVGQPMNTAPTLTFPDEQHAADHLAELIAAGARIAEFSRVTAELEESYIALDADRT